VDQYVHFMDPYVSTDLCRRELTLEDEGNIYKTVEYYFRCPLGCKCLGDTQAECQLITPATSLPGTSGDSTDSSSTSSGSSRRRYIKIRDTNFGRIAHQTSENVPKTDPTDGAVGLTGAVSSESVNTAHTSQASSGAGNSAAAQHAKCPKCARWCVTYDGLAFGVRHKV
jgi:hypothetical protein